MKLVPRHDIIEPDGAKAADRIGAAWRKGVENIIATGRLLITYRDRWIKEEPGKWSLLIGANQWKGQGLLPFSFRHAYRLISIAQDSRLLTHVSILPSDTYTLYQLTRLSELRFDQLLVEERIHPGMKRNEASAETRRERQQADEQRILS